MELKFQITLKLIMALIFVMLSSIVHADDHSRFLFLGGIESRFETNQDQNNQDNLLKSLSVGFGIEEFNYLLEYSYFKQSTGTANLSVIRKVENAMFWALWTPLNWGATFSPYLSVGLGGSQETIESSFFSTTATDKGRVAGTGGGGFGIKLNMPILWVSTEVRVISTEHWNPNPTVGFLGQIGLHF